MNFQATLIFSSVLFLSGFLGVKLWDLASGRDHVWEYAYTAALRRLGLPKLDVRPALDLDGELSSQVRAGLTEGACLMIALMPSWLWVPRGPRGARSAILANANWDSVQRVFCLYLILIAAFRLLWMWKFARR